MENLKKLLHVWRKKLKSLQTRCEKLVTWVDILLGKFIPIDNQWFRFFLLCITVGCGVLVGKFTGIQFFHDYLNQSEYASKYLALIIYAIPTLALLWYFRTRDRIQQIEEIREQINKTIDQIRQNIMINAIKHLNSGNIIREKVGANVLMGSVNLSQKFQHLIIQAMMKANEKFICDRSRREVGLSNEEIEKMRQSPGNEYPCREDLILNLTHPPINTRELKSDKNNLYRVYTIIFRFLLLVIVGCAGGLLLGMVLNVQFLFNFFTQDMEIAEHLINIIIGAPMFAILWYFRTFDARQEVNEMQEQASLSQKNIWQDRFNSAIEDLGSNDIAREEMGAHSLLLWIDEAMEFNETMGIYEKMKFNEAIEFNEKMGINEIMGINETMEIYEKMKFNEAMEFDGLIAIAFESTIDEFQREISTKGVKYYEYEKAKNPDSNIELNPQDVEYSFLVSKLGIEGLDIYHAREKIILLMHEWLQPYKKSKNNNTRKS